VAVHTIADANGPPRLYDYRYPRAVVRTKAHKSRADQAHFLCFNFLRRPPGRFLPGGHCSTLQAAPHDEVLQPRLGIGVLHTCRIPVTPHWSRLTRGSTTARGQDNPLGKGRNATHAHCRDTPALGPLTTSEGSRPCLGGHNPYPRTLRHG